MIDGFLRKIKKTSLLLMMFLRTVYKNVSNLNSSLDENFQKKCFRGPNLIKLNYDAKLPINWFKSCITDSNLRFMRIWIGYSGFEPVIGTTVVHRPLQFIKFCPKELSLCHKLKFFNPYIFNIWWYKPLIYLFDCLIWQNL